VAADSLRDELMALPGVAEAEIDETGASPTGVRVRLLPDADARAVGAEVQRVLAAHGMRSRLTSGDERGDTEASAPEPDDDADPAESAVPAFDEPFAPPLGVADSLPGPPPMPPVVPPPVGVTTAVLTTLQVEEAPGGVVVTATTDDGRIATERSEPTEEAMFEAITTAVGSLAEGAAPRLLAVGRTSAEGSEAMTVLLERSDGTRAAGAALTRAGTAYAVARATWAALRG